MEHFSHCCPKTAALPLGKRAVTPSLLIVTGRKAHLLEDKQISSVGVFDEHLGSFWRKYTWTQFGKKRDKIATLQEVVSRICIQCLETASQFLATPSERTRDGVKNFVTASGCNRLKRNPRRSGEAMTLEILQRRRGLFPIYANSILGF
ncbi:hypothetical protein Tco_0525841 [Tanacetum coccineum]